MYSINVLNPTDFPAYIHLTYPRYRSRLVESKVDSAIVAVGACHQSQAIGLAMAESYQEEKFVLLSIYVEPAYRNLGIGTLLLAQLEQAIQKRGGSEIASTYLAGAETTPYWEQILHRHHWSGPYQDVCVYYSTSSVMRQKAPWWYNYQLPDAFSVFPFAEITRQEVECLLDDPWYPQELSPFIGDIPLDRTTSLGMRYESQVVGWMVTHAIAPYTIRYSCLAIHPELQKLARGFTLVGASIQRQLNFSQATKFVCAVQYANKPMSRMAERRLAPLATSIREIKKTCKCL